MKNLRNLLAGLLAMSFLLIGAGCAGWGGGQDERFEEEYGVSPAYEEEEGVIENGVIEEEEERGLETR